MGNAQPIHSPQEPLGVRLLDAGEHAFRQRDSAPRRSCPQRPLQRDANHPDAEAAEQLGDNVGQTGSISTCSFPLRCVGCRPWSSTNCTWQASSAFSARRPSADRPCNRRNSTYAPGKQTAPVEQLRRIAVGRQRRPSQVQVHPQVKRTLTIAERAPRRGGRKLPAAQSPDRPFHCSSAREASGALAITAVLVSRPRAAADNAVVDGPVQTKIVA